MQLPVLASTDPWYAADGLNFTCSQCGNCCTGGPGFVWISREEIVRLAEFLMVTPADVVEQHCRKINGKFTLNEKRGPGGSYDCIFLTEHKVRVTPLGADRAITETRRGCAIYPVRPLQCRTWPFWPENLTSKTVWDKAGKRCHGINHGRHFTLEQIHAIRDAEDWPDRPPTSAAGEETTDAKRK
jgi:uncharacterized protein